MLSAAVLELEAEVPARVGALVGGPLWVLASRTVCLIGSDDDDDSPDAAEKESDKSRRLRKMLSP